MPVGRIEYLHLGPADFSEFAAAVNPWLASKLDMGTIRSEEGREIHPEMMRLLRLYMLVGGMPESVQRYADTRSVAEASAVHEQILGTYVVSVGRDIVPIEVKSGKTGTLRALRRAQEVPDFIRPSWLLHARMAEERFGKPAGGGTPATSDLRRRGRCGMMNSTNDKGARTNG